MSQNTDWQTLFQGTLLASAIILCGVVSDSAHALDFQNISNIYFFGDSLTDSGFNDNWPTNPNPAPQPSIPAGKAPTFTTFSGYTWSQYLARDVKGYVLPGVYPNPNPADTITNNTIFAALPNPVPGFVSGTLNGIDYAAGGSTTDGIGVDYTWAPSLHQQITHFLNTHPQPLDPNAVFFVWSGANDILGMINLNGPEPTLAQLLATSLTATNNIANEVTRLSAAGAKRIFVMSLPNFGPSPYVAIASMALSDPQLPQTMQLTSFSFNAMLNTALGKVIAQYHNKILLFDTYTLLDTIISATLAGKPVVIANQTFTFVDAIDPVCGFTKAIACSSTANGYVFADVVHPTDTSHQVIALSVEEKLRQWG